MHEYIIRLCQSAEDYHSDTYLKLLWQVMKEELVTNINTNSRHNPALHTTQYSESIPL